MSHFDQFTSHFVGNRQFFHVITITEIWLHSRISDDLVKLDNYTLIRNDRQCCRGEKIAVYVHNSLSIKLLELSTNTLINEPEYIMLELRTSPADSLLFTALRRRPKNIF